MGNDQGSMRSRAKGKRGTISPKMTFIGLWSALVLVMVLIPFIKGPAASPLFTVLFIALLGTAVMTIQGWKGMKIVALSLFIASAASRLAFSMTEDGLLELLSFIFASATLAWVTMFLFLSLFKRKEVTTTTLWEAVTVYILIGMTWASVYTILEIIYPGSFVDSANPSESMNFHTSMYYSFVTLATLGYGDIVPVTQEARGLVIVEVLTGVLYMAILISRLVGTWRRHTNGGDEK